MAVRKLLVGVVILLLLVLDCGVAALGDSLLIGVNGCIFARDEFE